jgi:hypothetical protein
MKFSTIVVAGILVAAILRKTKENDMQASYILLTEKLSHLCAMLEDAYQGYQMAAEYTRNEDDEIIFDRLSYERMHFLRAIKKEMITIGSSIATNDGLLHLLHRNWQEMRFKIKSGNKDIMCSCCVLCEKATLQYYQSIIDDVEMPESIYLLLSAQMQSIVNSIHLFTPQVAITEIKTMSLSNTATGMVKTSLHTIGAIISFLKQVASDFETIAEEIEDKNLRNAFISLSEEDYQFAEELHNQLNNFGIAIPTENKSSQWAEASVIANLLENSKRKELINICDKSEYIFLKLYTEALKEFLSVHKLRDIMVYQYNSIRAGFVKVRLLHSLRMNEQLSLD